MTHSAGNDHHGGNNGNEGEREAFGRIHSDLSENSNHLQPVWKEISQLRQEQPQSFNEDINTINAQLVKAGFPQITITGEQNNGFQIKDATASRTTVLTDNGPGTTPTKSIEAPASATPAQTSPAEQAPVASSDQAPAPASAPGTGAPGSYGGSSGSGENFAASAGQQPTNSVVGSGEMQAYATQLLQMMGLPVTPQNLQFLEAWQKAEGGGAGADGDANYNPFNTTQGEAGANSINSAGVKSYTSLQEGLQATASTLSQANMSGILSALKQGNNPMGAAQALAASPWGTGALVEQILGG